MKVLIDTNILISAILYPESIPALAYNKAVTFPNKGIICNQNIEELRRIFERKFSDKLPLLERFISVAMLEIEVVSIPAETIKVEEGIRDVKDRPILRCAIHERVDVLLSGDKDFIEANITELKIMTAREFLNKTL